MRCTALVLGMLVSCSSSTVVERADGGGRDAPALAADASAGGAILLDGFAREITIAACGALLRCSHDSPQLRSARLQVTDEAGCVAIALPRAVDEIRDLLVATGAGLARYDGNAARRCVSALGARCDLEVESALDLCPGLFAGTVRDGASCWRSEECAGDAWCEHGDTLRDSRQCPGVCRPRVALGGACRRREACSRAGSSTRVECSLVVARGEGGRCVAIASEPPGAEGARCGLATAATDPPVDRRCAQGLACVQSIPRSVCRLKLAPGAPCVSGDACADGTICLRSNGATGGVCSPLPLLRVGEPCDLESQDTMGRCDASARLYCVEGACRAAGDGSLGSECGAAPCNAGLYCDGIVRRCAAQQAAGAPCLQGRDEMCESGSCAEDTLTCLPRACRE